MIDANVLQIVTLAVTILTTYLIAHGVLGRNTIHDKILFAERMAFAAEELFGSSQGQQKFDYAVEQVCTHLGISREEAMALVTAAVNGLRHAGVKLPKGGEVPTLGSLGIPSGV